MSTNCCVCMEICAHSGPHTYCDKHKASDYYGTATPRGCPSCVALRARIEDVEGMAKVIFESEMDKTIEWGDNLGDWLRKNYLRHARAVSAWLKGG